MTIVGTLAEALARAAGGSRGIRAVEHDGHASYLSYAQLLETSLRGAAVLKQAGFEPGDRVALVVPEIELFIQTFFSLHVAGLVPVPLVPPAQAGDLVTFRRQTGGLLDASRARGVVTTSAVAPLLERSSVTVHSRLLLAERLVNTPAPPLSSPVAVAPEAPALLQFTSGSTSTPKGVVLSHRNVLTNVAGIAGSGGLAVTAADVGVSWLPLYHDMGLIGMLLTALCTGIDAVIMSPVLFLKRPTAWLETISQYRATASFAPNFAYDLCVRRVKPAQIAGLDLSCWRVAGCGAEPIRPDTLYAFAERFASTGFRPSAFVPSYGLAEHALAVTMAVDGVLVDRVDASQLRQESVAVPAPSDAAAVRLVSCGRPFPGHEIKIVDERGAGLPDRHVGHILARGPSVMTGYFEHPEATAAAVRDGWLDTGDLGYTADGSLFVCGRTKDLIIRHGRKYHPPDLESAIAAVEGLRTSNIVVFGIARAEDSDEVVAVLEGRASVTSDTMVDRVRRRIRETTGLELDRVVVAPPGTIPRTTSGKVRRAETRARLEAGTLFRGGRALVP